MSEQDQSVSGAFDTPQDIGTSPKAVCARWKMELKLADKREEKWRQIVQRIYKIYTPENPAANSFNILWPNTEQLRQSVYNSLPEPQVKRRYSDEDKLGKAVAEVLTRALEFSQDTYDMHEVLTKDVLAMLLAGRAVSRVRYVPSLSTIGAEGSESEDDSQESESYEEIEWEQVICERVQHEDFRILCAAKTWGDVTAIAFRHRMTRDDLVEKFGEEIGSQVPLDAHTEDEINKASDVQDVFRTAEIWEIWDKEDKQVLFVCPTYDVPCKVQSDPLQLKDFFPCPRPLYAIECDDSLIPACLYTQYEQQAKELNRISMRINKLIDALRVRGIYDATLSEIAQLMKGQDNELIPASNVTALLERGGLEKAIWMMPIDTAAIVLKELYAQRDATKQVIYEITGISDIMRSASDPNETFGAQKIKTQWGTQRLQRMQREVQRYIRDLVRLKAEIIAEKFQQETLAKMTLVNLPTQAQVDQQQAMMQQQWQAQTLQMQQQGQQPPPPPQMPPQITWEAVMQAMRDDATRTYRIDIETDSTLSATQDNDMQGMRELLTGITGLVQGFEGAVQSGAMPVDAVKQIILSVVRRARMGSAVEDALEKIQAPKPPADQNAGQLQIEQLKLQSQAQLEQMKAEIQGQQRQNELQANLQAEQVKVQQQMELERWKQEVQGQQIQQQNELQAQREMQRQELEAAADERKYMLEQAQEQQRVDFERYKAELDASTRIIVAQITAKASLDQAALAAETAAAERAAEDDKPSDFEGLADMHSKTLEAITGVMQQLARPKTIVRGEDGKATGIK